MKCNVDMCSLGEKDAKSQTKHDFIMILKNVFCYSDSDIPMLHL